MQIPRATYRLQFNEHFRLSAALNLVPYLHDLGISHVYCSPLFKASPHSPHGYDVCDFNQLNPEIGTEKELEQLVHALHEKKMGLVLDIVPNHMGIASPENAWWWDVLANGENSRFAAHFDIDWKPTEQTLHGKVLVPVLGAEYEEILKRGELQLRAENEQIVLAFHEHRFPLSPASITGLSPAAHSVQTLNADPAALNQLLRQQHYQLASYEHGDRLLNYRRFFSIASLAAVRVENQETFDATHALLRRWLGQGWLDGIRVDHPDGLRDPAKYLERLRALAPDAWIVIEKILENGEALPASWPIQGTTGYDFLNAANRVQIDPAAETILTDFYAAFTNRTNSYPALLWEKKRVILRTLLVAETNRLAGLFADLAAQNTTVQSYSPPQLRDCLVEVIAVFPLYRSYLDDTAGPAPEDVSVIKEAIHLACENRQDLPPEIFAFIHASLLGPKRTLAARDFAARFQQLTGAVMAKGAEDTAFYCFNRFVSLNEVGGDPAKFGDHLPEFHNLLQFQQKHWPLSQLASSTHDTKRSEDVRARLNVLSEIPGLWTETVRRWSALNERFRQEPFPDRNVEYLYYQSLVGAWPLSEQRIQAYLSKAVHEAKEFTDWTKPNARYETVLRHFVSATLRHEEFTRDVEKFIDHISEAAAVNSLAQTLLKLTAPGVPDIYQGCELLDFSLVDPDNRRPVDFDLRRELLSAAQSTSAGEAWRRRADGLPKLCLIHKTLQLRARWPDFPGLDYQPLSATGPMHEHVLAFGRGPNIITVVPRFFLKLNHNWQDTVLSLPPGNWFNEFDHTALAGHVRLSDLLHEFPVALLVRKENA